MSEYSDQQENVIPLAEYLATEKPLPVWDKDEFQMFSLAKEKTLWRRAFAFISDFFVIAMLKNMVSISYALFVAEFLGPLTNAQKSALASPGAAVEASVFAVVFLSYFFFCLYALDGKTLGAQLMKLSVVDEDYAFDHDKKRHEPNSLQALKRSLSYMLCYLSFGTFFFFSLLNEDRRGVPDFLSSTRVVSDEWLQGHKAWKKLSREEVRININSLDRAA